MMVMILLLVLVSQHASGVEVEVNEGAESVLLPCQVPADVFSKFTAAVWDRKELKIQTVHVCLQSGDVPDLQNDRYTNRTSMRADALQTGDLSLTLRNPTGSDSGTYTCTTRRFGRELSQTEVQLKVKEDPPPPFTRPVWVKLLIAFLILLAALLLLAAVVGLCVCLARKRMKIIKRLQPQILEVMQGQKSVQLRFTTTAKLPQDATVKWKLTEHEDMMVHVYESGTNQPDKQDKVYRGRTEMVKEPLRTGDLSLTLKDLQLTDSGVYTCTVYNEDGSIKEQKVTTLIVRVPRPEKVEVTQEKKSVLLPFKTTTNLPQDITVTWRLSEPKYMMVHVYERGTNHPDKQDKVYRGRTEMDEERLRSKDLSLTLKDLQLTDSGVYTCTVYNEDGLMLLKKSVTLRVRDPEMEVMRVTQERESVLLPFQPTVDLPQKFTVEWRLKQLKYMMVHVYERGTNHQNKQHKDYRGRTEMDKEPLRSKDLSLTLKDLQLTDSGVYTCTVYNEDGRIKEQKSVRLSVIGLQPQITEVTQMERFALLPFKATDKLPQDVTVEWKLTEPKYMMVHVYERGTNHPDKQDKDYRGRTEMDEERLRTGDFSLTLKHLQLTDSGVYTCTVYNERGDELSKQSVTLRVRGLQPQIMDVTQGEESVLLPFKTTAELPQDVTVEWRLTEPKYMMVHVYERGTNHQNKQDKDYRGRTEMDEEQLRTGDFSLTLKDLQLTDSGVYTCTVYNEDGRIKEQKSVRLSVIGLQPEIMKVTQGERFALLPIKTTLELPEDITVEWKLTEPKDVIVHVYERGTNHTHKQDQDYEGRTEMDGDQLRTGYFSLKLKKPRLTDSGVYTCTMCYNGDYILLQKSVTLHVEGRK